MYVFEREREGRVEARESKGKRERERSAEHGPILNIFNENRNLAQVSCNGKLSGGEGGSRASISTEVAAQ